MSNLGALPAGHPRGRRNPCAYVLVILIAVCCFGRALASTTIPGGTISTDTTWNLAGSPYIVTGLVEVQGTDGPDGVTTLTLEAGVRVECSISTAGLRIGQTQKGALVADGDAGGSPAAIVFTSGRVSPARGDWAGIRFGPQAQATSVLRNARLEYGGSGSYFIGALNVQTAAGVGPTLDELTIRENAVSSAYSAVYFQGGVLALTNSSVTANGGTGINVTAAGTVNVSGTAFSGNGGYDLNVSDVAVTGSIQDCPAIESLYFNGAGNPALTFSGNTFSNWGARTSRLTPDVAAR